MIKCKAILFDLDGTLIDSIAAVDRAWSRWAIRNGLDPADVVPRIHGRRAVDSLRLLAPSPDIDIDAEQAWLEAMESKDTEGIVPIRGALEFVASIPKSMWSIVTSGASPVAIARLNSVGLTPEFAVFGEEVQNGKPAPDPYLLAAKRMNIDPASCLVFEDTGAGVRSGKSAGMKVVAIAGPGDHPDLSEADAIVADYRNMSVELTTDEILVKFDSLG